MTAGANVGTAYLEIVPSARGFGGKLQQQVSADTTRSGRVIGERMGKAAGEKFGSHFRESFKGILAGLGVAEVGKQAIEFLGGSIEKASDLNETVSKTGQIFGQKALPALQRFAAGADKAMGQSKQQALDAAATFAIFGKSAGLNGQRLVGFSTKLTGLASDLASFHNTSPQEAIEAIGAALRGEAEPIRKYGILLDDASLKAEAMRLHLLAPVKDQGKISAAQTRITIGQRALNDAIKKHGKNSTEALRAQAALTTAQGTLKKSVQGTIPQLTQQQKVLAAQSLILRQSKDAQGDFARTSNGLANSQRIQAAEVDNLQAKIGQGLLPAQLAVTKFIANKAVPAISDFVDGMQNGTGAGGKFADALGVVVQDGKQVLSFFEGIPGPLRKTGAELAIAALLVPKLTAGFNALTNPIASSTAGMRSWIGAARAGTLTDEQFARAGVKITNAISNIAGVGGILLLAKSAKHADTAMGALGTTAGAAAVGFSMAGPWGAAIGAVGGLTFSLVRSVQAAHKNRAEYNKLRDAIAGLAATSGQYEATLNAQTGAVTRETRALALNRLEKSGLLDITRKLGLSDRDSVLAVTGDTRARNELARAIANNLTLTRQQREALIAEGVAVDANRLDVLKHNVAIAGNAQELKTARRRLAEFQAQAKNAIDIKVNTAQARQRVSAFVSFWNTEIGKMKTPKNVHQGSSGGIDVLLGQTTGSNATGTLSWRGGLTSINERGGEIIDLPHGTRIYPHDQSVSMAAQASQQRSAPLIHIAEQTVLAHDYEDFLRQQEVRARNAALTGG